MSTKLKTVGNETTMNLNNLLYQNVIASAYFKSLYEKKTYHEVIDEIYHNVKSLEPFMKGTHASTAFCLLYKLWTLRLTIKQVEGLIDHPDSPHIRAIGFLYLRYVCEPSQLWDWFGDYIDDEEEIQVEGGVKPRVVTIGRVCRELLSEPKWIGTILPRIPVPIARDLEKKLKENPPQTGKSVYQDDYEDVKGSKSSKSYDDYNDRRRSDDRRGDRDGGRDTDRRRKFG
ncbi:hypothetical protein HDU76_007013 [Blyttiomyces sp. JEL0837]|nr:hypothetical protein HDU76_007013 [Blyttiomyces sp. JEL0837]